MPRPEPYVSVAELATYLSVSEWTVRDWVKRRQVPSHKVGGARRFRLSEVDAWVEQRTRAVAS